MNTNSENTIIQRLEKKLARLHEELNIIYTPISKRQDTEGDEIKRILNSIRTAEQELSKRKLFEKVERINKQAQEKREFIKKILSIGKINTDIFCNDNTLHKSKRKLCPKLYEMKESEQFKYMYFSFNHSGVLCIHFNRFEFQTMRMDYNDKETPIKPWETFEQAVKFHSIPSKDITVKELLTLQNKLDKQQEKVKNEMLKLEKLRNESNFSLYNYLDLFSRTDERYYTYSINNK